jgi:GNAT superfamily N-acetyltransferase
MVSIKTAAPEYMPYLRQAMADLLAHVRDSTRDIYLLNLTDDYLAEAGHWLLDRLHSQQSQILIAQMADKPVGYVIGSMTRPYTQHNSIQAIGLIEHCWVEPAWRRQGVATKLVRVIEDWFRQQGIDYTDVQYIVGNREAEHAWVKLGYSPYRITARKTL